MATTHITISIEIMHDKNLNANQKFLLAEISQLSTLQAGCYAANRHFSELIGITRENVSKNLKALSDMGYISMEIKEGSRNHTRIITLVESSKGVYRNSKPPLSKQQETKENIHSNIQKNKDSSPKGDGEAVVKVFDYFVKTMKKNASTKLTEKRKRKIRTVMKDYSGKQMCLAIKGCAKSPWHMGDNPNGVKYNDLINIFKDDGTIDRFIELATTTVKPSEVELPADNKLVAWAKQNGAPAAKAGEDFPTYRARLKDHLRRTEA